MLTFLFLGEILHEMDFREFRTFLSACKEKEGVDYVVCNGSGILGGVASSAADLERLFESGIDVITTGERLLARPSTRRLFEENPSLIRPLNFPGQAPGSGAILIKASRGPVWVATLGISSDRRPLEDPFEAFENWLQNNNEHLYPVLVNLHGHDLPYKKALAWRFSSRVPVIHFFGTGIGICVNSISLYNGRIFISDIGTVEATGSIHGWKPDIWWKQHRERIPCHFTPPDTALRGEGVKVAFDDEFRFVEASHILLSTKDLRTNKLPVSESI